MEDCSLLLQKADRPRLCAQITVRFSFQLLASAELCFKDPAAKQWSSLRYHRTKCLAIVLASVAFDCQSAITRGFVPTGNLRMQLTYRIFCVGWPITNTLSSSCIPGYAHSTIKAWCRKWNSSRAHTSRRKTWGYDQNLSGFPQVYMFSEFASLTVFCDSNKTMDGWERHALAHLLQTAVCCPHTTWARLDASHLQWSALHAIPRVGLCFISALLMTMWPHIDLGFDGYCGSWILARSRM